MRIKKTSNTRALAGKVVNAFSGSTTDTYSCNYINDLTNIKTVEYTKQITTTANGFIYDEVSTSTPSGYALIGYIISGNGYVSQVISSIISSSNSSCVFNCFSTQSTNATIKIIGIYAKRVNQ